tara:strand:+ start:2104 stop:2322 length:219 start_codon:yes stop_codon:yes gene_type:complete
MDIKTLQKLAGINEFQGYTPYQENISHTGTEKKRIEREKNLRPGDLNWFKLWFSRPYWKGQEYPQGFRGRKK